MTECPDVRLKFFQDEDNRLIAVPSRENLQEAETSTTNDIEINNAKQMNSITTTSAEETVNVSGGSNPTLIDESSDNSKRKKKPNVVKSKSYPIAASSSKIRHRRSTFTSKKASKCHMKKSNRPHHNFKVRKSLSEQIQDKLHAITSNLLLPFKDKRKQDDSPITDE